MTAGFKETQQEELDRLRVEDAYKKEIISKLCERFTRQDEMLVECASALKKVTDDAKYRPSSGFLTGVAQAALDMAGSPEHDKIKKDCATVAPVDKRKTERRSHDVIPVGAEFAVYLLIYDPTLNKNVPSGHEFVGRFSTQEEANAATRSSR